MTKAELVQKMHAKSGLATKVQTEAALDALVAILNESMKKGEAVSLTGFGSFKVVARAARKGRNPRTGKEIAIKASKAVKFTPSKALEESVKWFSFSFLYEKPRMKMRGFCFLRKRQVLGCFCTIRWRFTPRG